MYIPVLVSDTLYIEVEETSRLHIPGTGTSLGMINDHFMCEKWEVRYLILSCRPVPCSLRLDPSLTRERASVSRGTSMVRLSKVKKVCSTDVTFFHEPQGDKHSTATALPPVMASPRILSPRAMTAGLIPAPYMDSARGLAQPDDRDTISGSTYTFGHGYPKPDNGLLDVTAQLPRAATSQSPRASHLISAANLLVQGMPHADARHPLGSPRRHMSLPQSPRMATLPLPKPRTAPVGPGAPHINSVPLRNAAGYFRDGLLEQMGHQNWRGAAHATMSSPSLRAMQVYGGGLQQIQRSAAERRKVEEQMLRRDIAADEDRMHALEAESWRVKGGEVVPANVAVQLSEARASHHSCAHASLGIPAPRRTAHLLRRRRI